MKFKILKRYGKWLIIWITLIVMFVIMVVMNGLFMDSFEIYAILTQNFWFDIILIFLLIPIFSVLAYFLGGYMFTPLFIFLHKKIIGRNLIYGIEQRKRPDEFKRAFIKSIFPALMAFNFAILLSNETWIHNLIFSSSFQSDAPAAVLQILTITILLPIVTAIGVAVFSATFFLIDSGIEYTNKEQKKVKSGSYPTEVRSIGTYYLYFLKGYAGISVIISIIQLLTTYLTSIQDVDSFIYITNLLAWPTMPFVIALFLVPAVIIQDLTFDSRNKFVKKWANKFGISGKLENPLGRNEG
jgi:hypothetical protein